MTSPETRPAQGPHPEPQDVPGDGPDAEHDAGHDDRHIWAGPTPSSAGPVAFTRTRRREGYDIAEVDAHLAQLRQALRDSERAINELQGDLNTLRLRAHLCGPTRADTRREASVAAARLLEIAARSAEQVAAESQATAARLLATARQEAEALHAGARTEADRLIAELDQRTQQQTADLEQQREAVITEINHHETAWRARHQLLVRWEADQREHLRRYLTDQLAFLEEC